MPNLEEDILTNWNLSVSVGTNPVLRCESIHLIGIVKSFPISNTSRILSENELYCNEVFKNACQFCDSFPLVLSFLSMSVWRGLARTTW